MLENNLKHNIRWSVWAKPDSAIFLVKFDIISCTGTLSE